MKKILLAAMISWLGLFATACSVTSGQQGTAEYVDDATITARVKRPLCRRPDRGRDTHPGRDAEGHRSAERVATSEASASAPRQLAAAVPGVKQVQNGVSSSRRRADLPGRPTTSSRQQEDLQRLLAIHLSNSSGVGRRTFLPLS